MPRYFRGWQLWKKIPGLGGTFFTSAWNLYTAFKISQKNNGAGDEARTRNFRFGCLAMHVCETLEGVH